MAIGRTLTGIQFHYSRSLSTGLVVSFKNSAVKITPEIISIIRGEIEKRSPVKMGANPTASRQYQPRWASYVIADHTPGGQVSAGR
jgi:hypothetical protein